MYFKLTESTSTSECENQCCKLSLDGADARVCVSVTDQWLWTTFTQPKHSFCGSCKCDSPHLCELEESWELSVCAFCAHGMLWIRSPFGIQQVSDFFIVDLHERDLHLEGMGLVLLFGDPLEQRAAESRDQAWLLSIAHHWEGFPRACQTTNTTFQRLEDILSPSRRVRTRQPACQACVGGQNAGLRTRTGRQREDRHWAIQHNTVIGNTEASCSWRLKHQVVQLFNVFCFYRFEQHKLKKNKN